MKVDRKQILETSLVLTTGFLVVYFVTKIDVFLYVSLFAGVTGIFIKPLAKYITIAWFKLADVLNYIMSKIILGTLFFVILLPIAFVYRLTNRDTLNLKRKTTTNWVERNKVYTPTDFENLW